MLLVAHGLYTLVNGGDKLLEIKAITSIALYVGNFAQSVMDQFPAGLGQTWSLAVEEQFYLVWPLALLLLLRWRRSPRALLWIALGLAALSAVARALEFRYGGGYPEAYMLPFFRFDGLLIGVAAAVAWRWRLEPGRGLAAAAWIGLAVLAVVTLAFPSQTHAGYYGLYALTSLGAVAVLLGIVSGQWAGRALFEWEPLRWVGKVSYGLYLWHPFVMWIVLQQIDAPGVVRALIAIAGSFAVTVASWRLVEAPCLRLKDRIAPHAAAPAEATDASPPRTAPPAPSRA